MYTVTSPMLLRWLMPRNLVWEIPAQEKVLYMTFDDGPVPGVTEKALNFLDQHEAKATFFCVGDNVRKYPELYHKILCAGHATGNHTYHHLNGWKTGDDQYIGDVQACRDLVQSKLFRPPYGHIRRSQIRKLAGEYKIIMWSVLGGDFDPEITVEQCCRNIFRNARPGSILVLHDQLKSADTMLKALPVVLDHYKRKGFEFRAIS